MLYEIFILLLGAAVIIAGVVAVKNREISLSWDNHGTGPFTLLQGWPAVLAGVAQVVFGLYVLSWAFKVSHAT
jgi:hypothetical protein